MTTNENGPLGKGARSKRTARFPTTSSVTPRSDRGALGTQPWVPSSIQTPIDVWRELYDLDLANEFVWHVLFKPWNLCFCSRCGFRESK